MALAFIDGMLGYTRDEGAREAYSIDKMLILIVEFSR